MSLGERVKTLRKRLGLTQKEFAAKILGRGDCTHIGKIERDQQYPSIKFLKRIGDTFSVPLSYFFQEEGPKTFGRVELRGSRVKTLLLPCESLPVGPGPFFRVWGVQIGEALR